MADIASLLGDAPPGEIDAVKQDILEITQKSNSVEKALEIQAGKSNVEQLRLVTVAGKQTVVSEFNHIEENYFYTHGSKPVKFEINHISRETKVDGDYDKEVSSKVLEIQSEIEEYLEAHYCAESVGCVFGDDDKQHVVIIGRKLSPQNFFNGQTTAVYTVANDNVDGTIKADVHYFEEGNVRLKSSNNISAKVTRSVMKTIASEESQFENMLNQSLRALNDTEFKQIRRQLPVTRQPVDWVQAIAGYNVGKDLGNR